MTASPFQPPGSGRWLDRVERLGNALPDPVFIFLALIGALVLASAIAAGLGWSALNPQTGAPMLAESLLSEANLGRLLVEMPQTLTGFPPLGLVLTVMLGAAVAERSGLFSALIGNAMRSVSRRWLTPSVFVIGVLSHHASDAAYVVLIPLAAFLYAEAGRHPLAGIAVAYAGISGAFAGNFVPGQFDVLMLGITAPAARLIDPGWVLNPLGNWWFTAAIGLVFTPIAWFVTDRIVEPRLGRWNAEGEAAALIETPGPLAPEQRRGLRQAGLVALLLVGAMAALALWPDYTPLVDEGAAGPARYTPFYRALIAGFLLLFLGCGWAYGRVAGTIGSHRDVVRMMNEGMRTVAPYLVIVFFAAHFVAMFGWSNMGPIIAVKGAGVLAGLDVPVGLLLVMLLLLSAVFDLFIGSASAKWAAMAPIVVPLMMMLGVTPDMTTAAYRMGDSIFNIVTPVASNFPLVLVMCQRWASGFGVGSVIALMLPYSLCFGAIGLLLVASWASLGLPVGPAAPSRMAVPVVVQP
ncbi:AbgT family transporter [Polymorphobacter sp.]|uniref:AbgT family transporter n=1 Tax=Polymorphobacter sp. TaxID=1909290 RepID=UPI003F6E682E